MSYRSGGVHSSPIRPGRRPPLCLQRIRVNGEAQLSYSGFTFIVKGNAEVIIQEADTVTVFEDRPALAYGEDIGYSRQSAPPPRKRRAPPRRKNEMPSDEPFPNTAENTQLEGQADATGPVPSDDEIEVDSVKRRRPFGAVCKQEPHDTSYGTVDLVTQLATSSAKNESHQDGAAMESFAYSYGEDESRDTFPQESGVGARTAYDPESGEAVNYRDGTRPPRTRKTGGAYNYNQSYPTVVWQQMVSAGHPLYKPASTITNAYLTMPSEHFLGGINLRDTFERIQQNFLRRANGRKPSVIKAWRIVVSCLIYAMLRRKEHIKMVTIRDKCVPNTLVDLTANAGDEKNIHRLLRLMKDLSGNIDSSDARSWNTLFACLISILKQTRRMTSSDSKRRCGVRLMTLRHFDALTGDGFSSRNEAQGFSDDDDGEEDEFEEEGNPNPVRSANQVPGNNHRLGNESRVVEESRVVVEEDPASINLGNC